jgi:hypothetical protein
MRGVRRTLPQDDTLGKRPEANIGAEPHPPLIPSQDDARGKGPEEGIGGESIHR